MPEKIAVFIEATILTELENTRILKQLVQIKNQFPENPYKIGKQEIMTRKNYFCSLERNV